MTNQIRTKYVLAKRGCVRSKKPKVIQLSQKFWDNVICSNIYVTSGFEFWFMRVLLL